MGCDIDLMTMRRDGDRLVVIEVEFNKGERDPYVFPFRNCAIYGFLADVYNKDGIPCISPPRGNPPGFGPTKTYEQVEREGGDPDSWEFPGACSWLTIDELESFDYETEFYRLRPGGVVTIREALGPRYFEDLRRMRASGVEMIVFRFNC
jgi:hypothetical protein